MKNGGSNAKKAKGEERHCRQGCQGGRVVRPVSEKHVWRSEERELRKNIARNTEQSGDDEAHPLEAEIYECVQQVLKLNKKYGYYTTPECILM